MLSELLAEIEAKLNLMRAKLISLQNSDGGFKGYYCHDTVSGVWATSEIVHSAARIFGTHGELPLTASQRYLVKSQNSDGGWPFRAKGKSITDITAWCCLALSHFGFSNQIQDGIDFLLRTRINEGSEKENAWGLTALEQDRVYSTWIASYCLSRLLRSFFDNIPSGVIDRMNLALKESKSWLLQARHADGSWGPTRESPAHFTSTAVALLTLFMQGEDPVDFKSSYEFLRSGIHDGLWEPEDEIVVTIEGYELPQQWFTSAICFRAMIFFAELGVASIDELDTIFRRLMELIQADGGVRITPQSSVDLVWTIPYMLDALDKYRLFAQSKQKEYQAFLERKQERLTQARKKVIEEKLQQQFPYPISQVFFSYQHELDHHRKFHLTLQLYEVAIKYSAIVGLSGYLLSKEQHDDIAALVKSSFERPSLGDWCSLLSLVLKSSEGCNKLLHPLSGKEILKSRKDYLNDAAAKVNLHDALSEILSLRNSNTGHGALRTLYEYKLLVERQESKLYSFFDRMSYLATNNSFLVLASQYDEFGEGDKYKIRVFRGLQISDNDLETPNRLSEGQKESMVRYIYFQNTSNNTIVNLYPFLSYMFCEECKREHFFFYNGARSNDKILYLSYECGHSTEMENRSHFQKRFKASGLDW